MQTHSTPQKEVGKIKQKSEIFCMFRDKKKVPRMVNITTLKLRIDDLNALVGAAETINSYVFPETRIVVIGEDRDSFIFSVGGLFIEMPWDFITKSIVRNVFVNQIVEFLQDVKDTRPEHFI